MCICTELCLIWESDRFLRFLKNFRLHSPSVRPSIRSRHFSFWIFAPFEQSCSAFGIHGVILSYSHIAFEVLGTIKKNIERNSIWLGCWYYISDKIMNIVAHKYYFLQCKKVLFLFLWIYNLSAGNFIRHVFWGLPLALSCAYLFWNDIWVYVHSSL